MGKIIKIIFILFVVYLIRWYIVFCLSPYKFCIDHPDPAKAQDYFANCKPFNIEIRKDFPRIFSDPKGRGSSRQYDALLEEKKKRNKEAAEKERGDLDSSTIDFYK